MNVIITGATRGTGKAIAIKFANQGFNIFAIACNEERLQLLKQEIENNFKVTVHCYSIDFNDIPSTLELAKKLAEMDVFFDVIINNVGSFSLDNLSTLKVEELDRNLNINLKSAIILTQTISAKLIEQQKGHIFNIGSIITKNTRTDCLSYSISKEALHGFTKALRETLRIYNVKVTEILPGSINTSSWDGIDAPKHEFIQTEEIADSIWNTFKIGNQANIEEIHISPLNKDF